MLERQERRHALEAGFSTQLASGMGVCLFDEILLGLNGCETLSACVPLVKSRHRQCVELLPCVSTRRFYTYPYEQIALIPPPPCRDRAIAEVIALQRSRAELLAERIGRLAVRIEAVECDSTLRFQF